MKSDNAANSKSKQKQGTPGNSTSANSPKKNKSGVTFNDAGSTATEKAKARSGRGLANEGTIVSYDEER